VSAAERLRRHRRSTVLVGGVLVVLVALSVLAVRSAVRGGALDPDNPRADGARAVARVLEDRGVDVAVIRRAADLRATHVDRGTTVLVTSTELLGRGTAREVDRVTRSAGTLVVADPSTVLVRALSLEVDVRDATVDDRTEARCADPLLEGLTVEVGPSAGYRPTGDSGAGTVACFPTEGPDGAALVVRVDRGVATYAVAGTDVFTNEHVDAADNAAVALRLLGQHDQLVWYVPDSRDVRAGDGGSLRAQLPRGLLPALWLVGVAVFSTMLWRGRRLGPLVVEPLPVVVKAVESTQGRGRLYRRVRDREHAAGILRDASRRRLIARLRLPSSTAAEALVHAVAAATDRSPDAVRDLLATGPVTDDKALTRLADALAALEREVHRP
jgi:hypothetical protein